MLIGLPTGLVDCLVDPSGSFPQTGVLFQCGSRLVSLGRLVEAEDMHRTLAAFLFKLRRLDKPV